MNDEFSVTFHGGGSSFDSFLKNDYYVPSKKEIKRTLNNLSAPFDKKESLSQETLKELDPDLKLIEIALGHFTSLQKGAQRKLIEYKQFMEARLTKKGFSEDLSKDSIKSKIHHILTGFFTVGIPKDTPLLPKRKPHEKLGDFYYMKSESSIQTKKEPQIFISQQETKEEELIDEPIELSEFHLMKNDGYDPKGFQAKRIKMQKAAAIADFFQRTLETFYPSLCKNSTLCQKYTQKLVAEVNLQIPDFVNKLFFKLPTELSEERRNIVYFSIKGITDFLSLYIKSYQNIQAELPNYFELEPIDREERLIKVMRNLSLEGGFEELIAETIKKDDQFLLLGNELEELVKQFLPKSYHLPSQFIIGIVLEILNKIINMDFLKFLIHRLIITEFDASIAGEETIPSSVLGGGNEKFIEKMGDEIVRLINTIFELGEAGFLLNTVGSHLAGRNKHSFAGELENLLKRSVNDECIGLKIFLILNHLLFEGDKALVDFDFAPKIDESDLNLKILTERLVGLIKSEKYAFILDPLMQASSIEEFISNLSAHLLFFSESPYIASVLLTFLINGASKGIKNQ